MGTRRTTDSPEMYIKTAALIIAAVWSYVFLVFQADTVLGAVLSASVLALAGVGIGFNVQHDGNHGGFSKYRWVNQATGFTLDLIGASSFYWKQKHNLNHHTYTNIRGEDDDIELGWFARVCEDHQWLWFHRYQQYYLWFLYSFVHLRYVYSDWMCLITQRMNTHTVKRPTGGALVGFFAGKALYLSLAFVIPMTRHSASTVVLTFLSISMLMGVIFSVVFQLAHLVDTVTHAAGKPIGKHSEWAVHQIETTSDFATGSRFLSLALGGLNFQREHHLFPKISHVYYPELAKVVKEVCDEYRVPYAETPKLTDALRSHYRYLKQMGMKPA